MKLCTYAEFDGDIHFFQTGNNLFGQIFSIDPKLLFKVKFGTWTNSNLWNSMMFVFAVVDQK